MVTHLINSGARSELTFFSLQHPFSIFWAFLCFPLNLSRNPSVSLNGQLISYFLYVISLIGPAYSAPSLNFKIIYYSYVIPLSTISYWPVLSSFTRVKIPGGRETYLTFYFILLRYTSLILQTQHITDA